MHKNNPDDFDELKLHKLEYYAKLWRNDYPKVPIKRVLLYRYHSKYMKYIKKMKNPNSKGPRYVVVFEVTGLELELYQERHFHYSPDILESLPWKEFMDEMDNILKNTCRGKSIFIYGYDGFELVYNQPPDDDFYKEWTFIAVPPEGPLPESVYVDDDSCLWVLWDINNPIEKDDSEISDGKSDIDDYPPETIELIIKSGREAQLLYKLMKRSSTGPGFANTSRNAAESRRDCAICRYEDNPEDFEIIQLKILDDLKTYMCDNQDSRHSDRYIIGHLIRKSLNESDTPIGNYQKCFELFKKIQKQNLPKTRLF